MQCDWRMTVQRRTLEHPQSIDAAILCCNGVLDSSHEAAVVEWKSPQECSIM
jgi:hypothetical protein